MRAEEMEPLVRIFREHQTGEQARRLFGLLRLLRRRRGYAVCGCAVRVSVLPFNFALRPSPFFS